MPRTSMFSEKDRAKIALMRTHGLTFQEIAERFNCHKCTIRYLLKPKYVKVKDRQHAPHSGSTPATSDSSTGS